MKPRPTAVLLSFLFAAGLSIAVVLVSLVLRFGLEAGFQTYLDTVQAAVHGRIMGALEALPTTAGTWDQDAVADLGRQALAEGLVLSLKDDQGRMVWSAREEAPDRVEAVFRELEQRLQSRVFWEKGRWEALSHPVGVLHARQGAMTLEVFQPRRLGPTDLAFLETLDSWLLGLAVLGVLCGIFVGAAMGRAIAQPLNRLRRITRRLTRGGYGVEPAHASAFAEVAGLQSDLQGLSVRLAHLDGLRRTAGADTAHELRTPLANLDAQLEALEEGILPANPERYAQLRAETRRLRALVEAWEDWERAQAGPAVPVRCDHPLEVVCAAVDSFRPRALVRRVELEAQGSEFLPAVALSSHDLTRIVVNLVENALRHSPEAGRIQVSLTASPGVLLLVDDEGPGIPAEHRDAVFDRFYRVDASRSRESGGLGLGLSLVRALAEASGGSAAAAVSPTGGCRIRVVLGLAPSLS